MHAVTVGAAGLQQVVEHERVPLARPHCQPRARALAVRRIPLVLRPGRTPHVITHQAPASWRPVLRAAWRSPHIAQAMDTATKDAANPSQSQTGQAVCNSEQLTLASPCGRHHSIALRVGQTPDQAQCPPAPATQQRRCNLPALLTPVLRWAINIGNLLRITACAKLVLPPAGRSLWGRGSRRPRPRRTGT